MQVASLKDIIKKLKQYYQNTTVESNTQFNTSRQHRYGGQAMGEDWRVDVCTDEQDEGYEQQQWLWGREQCITTQHFTIKTSNKGRKKSYIQIVKK